MSRKIKPHKKLEGKVEICKKCCSVKLDFSLSSKGVCDLCGLIKKIVSTYIFEDEIDRLFYFEIGGEG